MKLFEDVFQIKRWTFTKGRVTEPEIAAAVETIRETMVDEDPDAATGPVIGGMFASGDESTQMSFFVDPNQPIAAWFSFGFTDGHPLPPYPKCFRTVRSAIELVGPAESALSIVENRDQLNCGDRSRSLSWQRLEDRLPALHPIHFIDDKYIAHLGGFDHVLKTPVFKTERLLNGILLQIVDDYFDPTNPAHLAVQRAGMEHLGIWDYQPPVNPWLAGLTKRKQSKNKTRTAKKGVKKKKNK